jgi:hypothetical protein
MVVALNCALGFALVRSFFGRISDLVGGCEGDYE